MVNDYVISLPMKLRISEMGQSASQAHVFYKDVAKTQKVWTIRDSEGYPAPLTSSGKRAQPFWSSFSRAQAIIKTVAAYAGFEPVELSWTEFRDVWLPELENDGFLVGINWSGKNATGYDLDAKSIREAIELQVP
jgi:hypothetical protein